MLFGVWTTVIQLLLFLTIGTLKPDYTGECLHSIEISLKEHNNTFSSCTFSFDLYLQAFRSLPYYQGNVILCFLSKTLEK